MRDHYRWIIVAVLLAAISNTARGQGTLQLLDVDTTGYPMISARFYAFDAKGAMRRNLLPGDVSIVENATPAGTANVDCSDHASQLVSSVIAIDVSATMREKLDLVRDVAVAWIDGLPGSSE